MGYSGRDRSIMDALADSYGRTGPGTLYWCGYGDGPPPEAVAKLLAVAQATGRSAFYVPGAAFDDVMRRLALAGLSGAARDEVLAIIGEAGVDKVVRMAFTVPTGRVGGILKSTAFKLRCPVEAYSFRPKGMPERGAWPWVRDLVAARRDLVAVPFKGRIWALATLTAIHEVFGSRTA
jgi:hypothetical protein